MSTVFAKSDDRPNMKFTGKCVPAVNIDAGLNDTTNSTLGGSSSSSGSEVPTMAFLPSNSLKLTPQNCFPAFARSPISPTSKLHFKDLPQEIEQIEAKDLESFVSSLPPSTLLIFDIRPYNLYSNSRVFNSINFCVPSTLLKRESYALNQALGLIGDDQREQVLSLENFETVLIYDSDSTTDHISFSLYQTCLKFLKYSGKTFKVYFLNGGFASTDKASPLIEDFPIGQNPVEDSPVSAASAGLSNASLSPPVSTSSLFSSSSLLSPPVASANTPTSGTGAVSSETKGGAFPNFASISPISNSSKDNNSSQCKNNLSLSGFSLPSSSPAQQKFLSSIKRNTLPKLDLSNISGKRFKDESKRSTASDELNNYSYQFKYPTKLVENPKLCKKLPKWLQFVSDVKNNSELTPDSMNKHILQILNKKFNKIEKVEQARLRKAISCEASCFSQSQSNTPAHSPNICSPSALCPGCDNVVYKIPKGIEYGYKNRYNNIWPYEHSRVKLNANSPSCTTPNPARSHRPEDHDDYFNANYIDFKEVSKYQYIATQNPLQATYEDFWKTIWHNNINIIVCLNKQLSANLAGQDLKYFDNQTFRASKLDIKRINTEENDVFILREIKVSKRENSSVVYHLEFKNWPDFGVPSSFESILELIDFKNKLIAENTLNPKLLVHCSAGCGRTGCFITLDMILDCFKNLQKGEKNLEFDPWGSDDLIYKTVQFQRRQRISMVQNLDQFIVCYEILLDYVVNNLL